MLLAMACGATVPTRGQPVTLPGVQRLQQLQQAMPPMLQVRLPAGGVSKASGLFLDVSDDGLGVGQFGYRQLRFTMHAPTPLAGDTQITVRAFVSDWNTSRNTVSVEQDGELKAGQTTATVVVRIPQTTEWNQAWWDVWIDGSHDLALSVDVEQPRQLNNAGNSRWQNSQMLRLDASRRSNISFRQLFNYQAIGRGAMGQVVQGELSKNWLDYTPYDIVSLDIASLQDYSENQPAKLAALEEWVRSGGRLWIEEVGDGFAGLAAVHPLFDWKAIETVAPIKPAGNAPAGVGDWTYVNLHARNSSERDEGLVQDFDPEKTPPESKSARDLVEPVFSEDWFIVRRHGWGMVGAFESTIDARPRSISTAEREAGVRYWTDQAWPMRHGTVPGMANNDFSNWLIPGVGLAPVMSFQVLITLFVLAIGPMNYWLLKRAGRLHLMVLTVPLGALAITTALLGYGVLSDGFTTRVRAMSITLLDQQTGDAATWSRLSYYAAFAPQKGLTFSHDTAVYPILPGSLEASNLDVALAQRDLVWTTDEQRLAQGWLASRTPTQYLAIQPRRTKAKLDVGSPGTDGTVRNQFDAPAQLIVAVDDNDTWRMAEDVAVGKSARLVDVERTAAVAAVRERLAGREPQFPSGFTAVGDSPLLYDQQRRLRRRYRQQNLDYGFVAANQSLLQDRWLELLGFSGTAAVDLPARSYLMICETAPLPISKDDFPVEDSSVHLVVGRW